MESLEEFRSRARAWIVTNLRPLSAATGESDMRTEHALQIKLAEGGFAGIAIPKEYGGAGLTLDHQRVWAEEIRGYETPMSYCVSIGMMLPTIMDHGSEALKARHIPRMLRGDETFIQLLSEPGGGSDMAGAQTRATRKGDGYVISGSKMWSSGADSATYGICLARVNWDAQKHQGLGMFVVPLKDKAVTITPIVPANGGKVRQFIEYLDDVVVPDEYVLGHEGQGWVVAQRLLFHERNATVGLGYGYGLGGSEGGRLSKEVDTTYVARRSGAINDPAFASTIADNHIALVVAEQLSERLGEGMRRGKLVGGWGSLSKLGLGVDTPLSAEAALAVAGAEGVVWTGQGPAPEVAMSWLVSRGISIAGGSNEMQRNIISERLMGLPKDPGDQNTAPFSELMKRRSS
jgi:alkylation response protein AidB-like acyl-CoA dehydrogenase